MGREERLRRAVAAAATDPPIPPLAESLTWFETGPYGITGNPALATVIVRVGLASNALNAQLTSAVAMLKRKNRRYKMRDGLFSLVTTAAFTNEAIRLAQKNMSDLKDLARRAGAKDDLLKRVGKLCGGHHPASEFLGRARNQLGFHWDADVVQASLNDYARNEKLVWVESDAEDQPFHRLAGEVLAHALFPDSARLTDPQQMQAAIKTTLSDMGNAIDLIVEFFTAAVYGFLKVSRATRRARRQA